MEREREGEESKYTVERKTVEKERMVEQRLKKERQMGRNDGRMNGNVNKAKVMEGFLFFLRLHFSFLQLSTVH